MKKKLSYLLIFVLILSLCLAFAGCSSSEGEGDEPQGDAADTVIKVGASPAPHQEILEVAKPLLEEQGYTLEIVSYNDYILPNTVLEEGDLDANYFQHITYLKNFNEENDTHLVSAAEIHYEPFGIYAGKTTSLDDLQKGASVGVPNDPTNEARALLLLEQEGLIKLKEGVGILATVLDIEENPKELKFNEVEAAQLPRLLPDVDIAVINGNYAIDAGLKIADALAIEAADSEAGKAYVNVVAVKEGNENLPKIKALVEALESDEVKQFIEETYNGAVVPVF